jgi:hypothetical protein
MKYAIYAAAAALVAESAALACSCLYTEDPAELQRLAAEVSKDAVALVEVEALTSYESTGQGERMKVVQLLAGTAPAQFQVARGSHVPSSASCDILYKVGERDFVILYPGSTGAGTYRTSGLCTAQFLDRPAFRDAVAGHIGAGRAGERG